MTTEFQPLIKSRNGVLGSASNNRWQASVELVDMTPAYCTTSGPAARATRQGGACHLG